MITAAAAQSVKIRVEPLPKEKAARPDSIPAEGSGTTPLHGPAPAYATAFSPDGTILATGYKNGSTYLWNVASSRLIATLHDPGAANGKEVDSVAFSPDGRTLATGDGNGYTNLWNVVSRRRGAILRVSLADPAGAGVFSVAFSSQGTMATGDYDGHVYLWDLTSGATAAGFSLPGTYCTAGTICDSVSALAFSDDGNLLAAGTESGIAEIWNVARHHGSPDHRAGRPPGGDLGAVVPRSRHARDGLRRRQNLPVAVNAASLTATVTGTLRDPNSGRQGVGTLAFSADGQYLVTGDTNGSAYLWKVG